MEKREKLLRIILTAATILLLVFLAWHCLDIYRMGNSPANLDENGLYLHPVYRAEDVITRLSGLRIWGIGYLMLLATVCVRMPGDSRKGSVIPIEPDNRLRLLKKKFTDLPEATRAEEALRRKVGLGTGAAVVLCAGMCLIYLLNRDNFISWDLELVMGQMLVHTLPWISATFAAVIAATFVCRRSMEREICLLRGIPGNKTPDAPSSPSRLFYVRIVLYVLAVILIVGGIGNGGMRDVLIKAINICTECIGLG